ncbi:hypothetical protein [uncultured Muribaculum sp.]|uniref:hypothetical protein n=1 Tax=uncultured Muribaculum sp. TaxID=1918613 RepID=UPI002711F9F1|nr:hypothetical protein [uncultured Muribaculum sp.]
MKEEFDSPMGYLNFRQERHRPLKKSVAFTVYAQKPDNAYKVGLIEKRMPRLYAIIQAC